MSQPTQESVDRALDNAAANGYSFSSARSTAIDLLVHDADLEADPDEVNVAAILPLVEDWRARRRAAREAELRDMHRRGV